MQNANLADATSARVAVASLASGDGLDGERRMARSGPDGIG